MFFKDLITYMYIRGVLYLMQCITKMHERAMFWEWLLNVEEKMAIDRFSCLSQIQKINLLVDMISNVYKRHKFLR